MAITDPTTIKFINERLRTYATSLLEMYYLGKETVADYGVNFSGLIPNSAGETVQDAAYGTNGTDGDGRKIINGAQVVKVAQQLTAMIAELEANSDTKINQLLELSDIRR